MQVPSKAAKKANNETAHVFFFLKSKNGSEMTGFGFFKGKGLQHDRLSTIQGVEVDT